MSSAHSDERAETALRINADHARATTFLIHDGVVPSNEGRGYVLRKIMRRAMRNGRLAGATEPYLYKLTGFVADLMKPAYPELQESVDRVARIVREEESRYATTFQIAERFFQDEAKSAVRRRASRCGRVQALRHLRPGARRAGGNGARVRPHHRSRELQRRDGEAAHTRPRQLERCGQGAHRGRL